MLLTNILYMLSVSFLGNLYIHWESTFEIEDGFLTITHSLVNAFYKFQPLDNKVNSTFFFQCIYPVKNSKQFFLEEMYSSLLRRTSCPNNNLRFETREG